MVRHVMRDVKQLFGEVFLRSDPLQGFRISQSGEALKIKGVAPGVC